MRKDIPKTIDEYIAAQPRDVQVILRQIRDTLRKAAPDAKERIAYQMPTFGKLMSVAAWKEHIGIYPGSGAIKKFKKELAGYAQSKGTVQFRFDEPIPHGLIAKIAKFRAAENAARAAAKAKAKAKSKRKAKTKTKPKAKSRAKKRTTRKRS